MRLGTAAFSGKAIPANGGCTQPWLYSATRPYSGALAVLSHAHNLLKTSKHFLNNRSLESPALGKFMWVGEAGLCDVGL